MDGADRREASAVPGRLIWDITGLHYQSQALYTVAKLGIADLIQDQSLTAGELAAATGSSEPALYRVMRFLACLGVFEELRDRRFALTAEGQTLREDHPQSHRYTVIFRNEELFQSSGKMLHTVRTGETAFDYIFGEPLFDYLNSHPEALASYQMGMRNLTISETQAILDAYDFSGFNRIVDLGGGNGAFLSGVLSRNENLSAILLDREATIELARSGAGGPLPRCDFQVGDFFKSVPRGGDVYSIKSALHDWTDEQSIAILRNCREAMEKGMTFLIIESVVGPPNEISEAATRDVGMLVNTGGMERRLDEYIRLLEASGFEFCKLIDTDAAVSIIESHAV